SRPHHQFSVKINIGVSPSSSTSSSIVLIIIIVMATDSGHSHTKDHARLLVNTHHAAIKPQMTAGIFQTRSLFSLDTSHKTS
ncbi:hypothetical protein, partial [Acetobacter tropicalis]